MQLVVLPSELLKKHNISSGNSVELKAGEGTWFVEVCYNEYIDYGKNLIYMFVFRHSVIRFYYMFIFHMNLIQSLCGIQGHSLLALS